MAGMDSLRSLLQLNSPTNVTRVANQSGQRGLDLLSSEADLIPGDEELRQAQSAISGAQAPAAARPQGHLSATTNFANELQGRANSGVGVGVSQEQLQEGAMGGIRRKLGLQQREHEQALERAVAPAQLRAESAQAVAEERARSAEERAQMQQQSAMERLLAQLQGRGALQEDAQAHGAEMQQQRLDAQGTGGYKSITQGNIQSINKAEEEMGKQWFPGLQRRLGMDTGTRQLEAALVGALQQEGSINDINSKIAEAQGAGLSADELLSRAQQAGIPITPYQARYIKLKMTGQ